MSARVLEVGEFVRGVDYYELLGVDRAASAAEIKVAYRSLAKVMHPDAGGTDGTFRLLREAYETLTDPQRRGDYDTDRPAPVTQPPVAYRSHRRRAFGEDPGYVPELPRLAADEIGWWQQVDVAEQVQRLPATGAAPKPVALAVGGWLALVLVGLSVPLSPLLLTLWLVLVGSSAVVVSRMAQRYLVARRADRAFVAEFGAGAVFGRIGQERAQLAERLTGELMTRYLTRLPGLRVFHGLSWPGSVFADIDHALLRGRRLVLVESKLWLPGHYEADEDGELWRNGHPFRGGAIRLPDGVAAYQELLPQVEVRGAVVVYANRSGEITTEEPPDLPAPPMSPEWFVEDVGGWLAEAPAAVDREVFRTVLAHVVSP